MLLRTMVLAFAVRAAGVRHLSYEHPLSAFSWAWSKVTGRFDHVVDFDVCVFRRAALERPGIALAVIMVIANWFRTNVCPKLFKTQVS